MDLNQLLKAMGDRPYECRDPKRVTTWVATPEGNRELVLLRLNQTKWLFYCGNDKGGVRSARQLQQLVERLEGRQEDEH